MPKLLFRSLPLYKASLNMMNLFFLADSEVVRARLSRSLALDQCLCNVMYSGEIRLACSAGRHLFFVTKTLFHKFIRHFNKFPHRNSRVLGGKPKWLPQNVGFNYVMRTFSEKWSTVTP